MEQTIPSSGDDIKSVIEELKELTHELKDLNKRAKEIRERKKLLENDVLNFLNNNGKKGLTFGTFTFLAGKKKKTERKKKLEKLVDGQSVLCKYGVSEPMKCLEEVVAAMKGAQSEISALKVKEISFTDDF